jgi:hypothetical protein
MRGVKGTGPRGIKPAAPAVTPADGATPAPRVLGRTASLPGLENPIYEDVSNAALSLFNVQEEKKAVKKREDLAAVKLFAVMAEHGVTRYKDTEHNLVAERITSKEKVKVRFTLAGKKKAKP